MDPTLQGLSFSRPDADPPSLNWSPDLIVALPFWAKMSSTTGQWMAPERADAPALAAAFGSSVRLVQTIDGAGLRGKSRA